MSERSKRGGPSMTSIDPAVIAGFERAVGYTGDLDSMTNNVVGLLLLNIDTHDDSSCRAMAGR